MNDKAIIKTDAAPTMAVEWQVLRLPEILAIFRLGKKDNVEKCPIWTF